MLKTHIEQISLRISSWVSSNTYKNMEGHAKQQYSTL